MKTFRVNVPVAVAAIAMVTALLGQNLIAQQSAAAIFERARMLEETVSQNLSEAIQLYQQVAARGAENRPLAAQAQLRIGVLYERLGRITEARQAYEGVVSSHATQQSAVADARARLNALTGKTAVSTGLVVKSLWTAPIGADIEGVVSPDGRYVPYGKDDAVYLHDLTTGTDRKLTEPAITEAGDFVDETMFSRDGKRLAFSWYKAAKDRYEIRVVNLQETGAPQTRLLFDNQDVAWIGPFDWSPDGKSIAVQLSRRDGNRQMGLIGAEDGSLRLLRPTQWRSLKMFFSPDGRYLAFDLPASESNPRRDVFVMPVDGSRDIPVMVNAPSHDTIVGWSPDGTHLLVASDRTGLNALWRLPFTDGVIKGQPELLNGDLGRAIPMGVLKTGSLYFERLGLQPRGDIQFAEFDISAARLRSQPVPVAEGLSGSVAETEPSWSPDGKSLAYTSERRDFGGRNFVIAIRSVETGQLRAIVPKPIVSFYQGARWWPDGRSLVAAGVDVKGRWGVFRIDAQTGTTSTLFLQGPGNESVGLAVPAPDGAAIYYRRFLSARSQSFVKRDLASGQETQLIRRSILGGLNLSPDGRYIATPSDVPPPNPNAILLIPTDGGEMRELASFGAPGRASVLGWAADSRSILLWKSVSVGTRELWRVFLDGREAVKLETNLGNTGRAVPSPDGRHVALQTGSPAKPSEVWVMENFLPTSRK